MAKAGMSVWEIREASERVVPRKRVCHSLVEDTEVEVGSQQLRYWEHPNIILFVVRRAHRN